MSSCNREQNVGYKQLLPVQRCKAWMPEGTFALTYCKFIYWLVRGNYMLDFYSISFISGFLSFLTKYVATTFYLFFFSQSCTCSVIRHSNDRSTAIFSTSLFKIKSVMLTYMYIIYDICLKKPIIINCSSFLGWVDMIKGNMKYYVESFKYLLTMCEKGVESALW